MMVPLKSVWLVAPNLGEFTVGDGLDEAVADDVESRSKGPDVFERGVVQALLYGGRRAPAVESANHLEDQRSCR